jgi:hypothetical protein
MVVTYDSLNISLSGYNIGGKSYNVKLSVKWRPYEAGYLLNMPSLWELAFPGQLKKEYNDFIAEFAKLVAKFSEETLSSSGIREGSCVLHISTYIFEGKFLLYQSQ